MIFEWSVTFDIPWCSLHIFKNSSYSASNFHNPGARVPSIHMANPGFPSGFKNQSASLSSDPSRCDFELSRRSSSATPTNISTHDDGNRPFTESLDPNPLHELGTHCTSPTHETHNAGSEGSIDTHLDERVDRITNPCESGHGRQENDSGGNGTNHPTGIRGANRQERPIRSTSSRNRELAFQVRPDPRDVATLGASNNRQASQTTGRVHSDVSGTARLALVDVTSKGPRRTSRSSSGNGQTGKDEFDVDAWMFGRMEERWGWTIR